MQAKSDAVFIQNIALKVGPAKIRMGVITENKPILATK